MQDTGTFLLCIGGFAGVMLLGAIVAIYQDSTILSPLGWLILGGALVLALIVMPILVFATTSDWKFDN